MSDKTIREELEELLTTTRRFDTGLVLERAKESFLKRVENPWISVKDKLPNPKVGSVLLFSKASGVAEGEFRDNKWLQYRWSAKVTPSHWKQLPQTPEEQ